MAKPPKPPHKERRTADIGGHSPQSENSPAKLVDLNLKVSHEFKRRMRQFALDHNMKVKDLLILAFEDYERKHAGIYSELGVR